MKQEYFRLKKFKNWHRLATFGVGAMCGKVIDRGDIMAVQIAEAMPKPACSTCRLTDDSPRREITVLRAECGHA